MAPVTHKKPKFMNNILDDIFHPTEPVCQIIKTSTTPKKDIFKECRAKCGTCLDYNISQTGVKLDAGRTKIHIEQTKATYVPNEKSTEEKKPKRKKKIRYFSGGPPQWEFIDEKWRREQEEKQKVYRQQLQERLAKAEAEKKKKRKQQRKKRKKLKTDGTQI